MCDYCQYPKPLIVYNDGDDKQIFVDISAGFLRVFDNELPGMFAEEKINFCPNCGADMREES